jgi:hypothetical protein
MSKSINPFVSTILMLLVITTTRDSRAQSVYSNAVMSLAPVAYWPLQETAQPPAANVETNLGSLGTLANAYYASTNVVQGFTPGAITGDADTAVNFLGNASSFMIVPTTDNRVSLPAAQPFTVECWTRPTGSQSYVAMVSQTGPNNAGGLNASTNSSGWSLCQNFAAYRGTGSGNNPACWSFHVFNGVGFTGGAEAETATNVPLNQWTHLVGVFDGTNCWLYANGNSNGISFQIPITTGPSPSSGGYGSPLTSAAFSPDTWDPIEFGGTRGLGANPFHGCVDEVAVYTNALTYLQISNHYAAATNGLGNYQATVLGDNPCMYWRMDAPLYTNPPVSSYPVAANYGSVAAGMTNFNTSGNGINSAVYQPGTVLGVAGPQYAGFGSLTNACAFNGLVGAVDAGYNSALNPVGLASNFTFVAWFKANPMDNNSRYNCLASHSNGSWKAQFNNGTTEGYKGASTQATIAPATFNVNDGHWHMYVLESSYTNGVGTNVTVSLDSGAVSATVVNTAVIPGAPGLDAFIGGAPDYLEPTNGTYNTAQQYFAGRIAHVAYFTNALSLSQIQSLFYAGEPTIAISSQPVSAAVNQNTAFTNTVVAMGNAPYSYQWYAGGAAIGGATNASLIFNPVLPGNASTNYFVIVTNNYGAITSAVVSLTVYSNVTFAAQFPITYTNPITLFGGTNYGGTNYLGSTPAFSVVPQGAVPFGYQWTTNGVAVGGATNASFTFTNCQMTSPTNFACVVTNIYGPVTNAWLVSYQPAPTAPFPQAVLADSPISYWRLNEPDDEAYDGNDGALCNDYQSGNNGLYTNVYLSNFTLGTGYSPDTDPAENSAEFGIYAGSACDANSIGTNIDFSGSSNAEFTVAVWANGNSTVQPANAGLVAKGYFNGEEFIIDEGSTTGGALRFGGRAAASPNTFYGANSTIKLGNDSNWHFVVGVCDEVNTNMSIYVDGQLAASVLVPLNTGLIKSSAAVPLIIGARSGSATALGSSQFKGLLNDAAIYNYAMSSNQILAQYQAAGIPPNFTTAPASTNVNTGGNLVIPAVASGSQPLSYHWFDVNANIYMPGQTNATLVISNITTSDSYYLTVTNAFGSTNSATISANVVSGQPQIFTDVKNPFYGVEGHTAANSVAVYGTSPLAYQWQFLNGATWVNLADNGHYSGSQGSTLTILNTYSADAGNYQVVVTNVAGSTTSSVATLIVAALPLNFYGTGLFWGGNGSAHMANGLLSLTDPNNGGGTGSFFFDYPQYIGAFQAAFTYQAGGNMAADGVTFCVQNDPRGTTALGGGGGELGVGSTTGTEISPSFELELNIYTANIMGYSLDTYGAIGPNVAPGGVKLNSGDPITITVNYANSQMALTFMDAVAGTSYSTNLYVGSLADVLGTNTAYVGFTGAYGGDTSVQTITNFTFVSLATQTIQLSQGTNALVSWPGAILGYGLQQNSDLTTTNWLNVTNPDNVINGQHQIIMPLGVTNLFYRLMLQ